MLSGPQEGAQVLICEGLEGLVVPLTLEILHRIWGTVLDRWVTLHPVLLAQGLALRRAIDVGNQRRGRTGKILHQLVPIGLQRLAVASPWCQKLDEHRLPRGLCIPIVGCQLDGACAGHEAEEHSPKHGCDRRYPLQEW